MVIYNNQLLAVPESEEVDIAPGEKVNLISYFTPDTEGRHIVNGRIYYNKKITYEKTSEFRVYKAPGLYVKIIPLIIYLLILVAIIYLIVKISRERRKKLY